MTWVACSQRWRRGQLGDGRWLPACSRSTKLAVYLIAERALSLLGPPEAAGSSTTDAGADVATAPVGYVMSLPGCGRLTSPVHALNRPVSEEQTQLRAGPLRAAEELLLKQASELEDYITQLRRGPSGRYFPSEVFSPLALRWALGCVMSRSFSMGGDVMFLPLIDMMNHQPPGRHNTIVQHETIDGAAADLDAGDTPSLAGRGRKPPRKGASDDDNGCVVAKTTVDLKKGDELMVCCSATCTGAELQAKYGIISSTASE